MENEEEKRNKEMRDALYKKSEDIDTNRKALYESEEKVTEETDKRTFFEHLSHLHLIAGIFFLIAGIVFILYWNGESIGISAEGRNSFLWATCSLMAMSFLLWTIILSHNPKLTEGEQNIRSDNPSKLILFTLGFLVITGGVVALNLMYNNANTPSAYIGFSIIVPAIFLGYMISYYWTKELLPYVLDKYVLNETGVTMNQFGLLLFFIIIITFVTLIFKDSIFSGLNTISIIMLLIFGGLCVATVAYMVWTWKTDKARIFNFIEQKAKDT
jgi:hypothetical protein